MNDTDYLNDILETEKNMSVNMCIALNETSNEDLFDKLYKLFKTSKKVKGTYLELAFRNGWYSLEKKHQIKLLKNIIC